MTWLELDDRILEHPKFIRAVKLGGSEAIHLWLGLRAYCGQQLSDGFIPEDMLSEVRGPTDSKARSAALRVLVSVRLVDQDEGGYRLHDFLDWSTSRAEVEERRARARDRQGRYREKSRVSNAVSNAVTSHELTRDSRTVGERSGGGSGSVSPEGVQGEPEPDALVGCPPDLRLTDAQLANAHMVRGVTAETAAAITAEYVGAYLGKPSQTRTVEQWRSGLWKAVMRDGPDREKKRAAEGDGLSARDKAFLAGSRERARRAGLI